MKITMFVTENGMQFNLMPENEHEKRFLKIMDDFKGRVTIHRGIDVGLCQSGFIRNFSFDAQSPLSAQGKPFSVLAVTILKDPVDENPT